MGHDDLGVFSDGAGRAGGLARENSEKKANEMETVRVPPIVSKWHEPC
jgi:hypothetical protein